MAKVKKDMENYRRKQSDIDLLESSWFVLRFLRGSKAFNFTQSEKIRKAFQIIDDIYKQFDQFEISKKYNWNLTVDKHPHIEDKENHINYLETTWLSLAGLRHFKTFTVAQREKINGALKIISEVYKEFDQSKYWGDDFGGWQDFKQMK